MTHSRGSAREIELLYRQHGRALLLFATAMMGERERAQDAVQQVFLRLLQHEGLRQVRDKKAYLFACVRNALLNETKAQRRNTELQADEAWFDPPHKDYAAEQNLRRALASLPQDQREVVVLHIWGDLTFTQAAELLEISPNTAASRYRYGLEKLREAMCRKENPCATEP